MKVGLDGLYAPRIAIAAGALLLALIAANVLTLSKLAAAREGLQHSADLAMALADLESDLTVAETSQRGFLLTGQPAYLEPLQRADRQILRTLADLRKLTADNPRQRTRIASLERQTTAKLGELRGTVALWKQGKNVAAMGVVRSGAGRSVMDTARAIIADVKAEEDLVLQAGSARLQRFLTLATWIGVGAGAGLLGLLLLLLAIGRDVLRRDALERTLRAAASFQQRFVAMVGHDLRSPLSAISMGAQHLQQQDPTPAQAAVLRRITSSSGRMDRMVQQLLDLARVQIGGLPIEPKPGISLAETVAAAAEEVRVAHPECEIRVRHSGDTTGTWDPDQLAQVASNILANAVQHGRPPIDAVVTGDGDLVVLEVHDGGLIPEDIAPRLFDPFRRGQSHNPAERRRTTGLGLGLFICKSIVEGHGGTLDVHSSRADGTTFRITLPRVARTAPISAPS